MLLDFHSAQTAPAPAIIAPAPKSSRDEFPSCRNWGAGQPKPAGCAAPQLRQYWIDLSRQVIDPEHGPMLESLVIDAEIHAGYLPQDGGGEVARLTALVAAEYPTWEITGLSLADAPEEEF
jgi:hypothetical protein